jgi:LacI family transcriptional regulator
MPIVNQSMIAKELNVSRATVSKALKDTDDISVEMKKRVRDLAEKMNYIPHYHARRLHSQKTKTIGVVVPDVSNTFFSYAIDGIMDVAVNAGYHIILTVLREKSEIEKTNLLNLLSMRVDGLLVAVSRETKKNQIFLKVKRSEVPLVFFDRAIDNLGFCYVGIDDKIAARKLIDFVIRCGFTKIGHLAGSLNLAIGKNRYAGYLESLKRNRLPIRPEWIIQGRFEREDGYRGFKEIWKASEKPEVIFAANDHIALGVYDAMREIGISVPDQVGVVAFGHHVFAQMLTPKLTIINVDPYFLGKKAMELMLNCIKEEKGCRSRVLIDAEIEIGESLRISDTVERVGL